MCDLIHFCFGLANAGVRSTGLEGIRLWWRDRVLLGDENGLAQVSSRGSRTRPDWFRRDARWLTCGRRQVVNPGEVRWLVAPLILRHPPDFPDLTRLRDGQDTRFQFDDKLIFEVLPVIGAPVATELCELKRYDWSSKEAE